MTSKYRLSSDWMGRSRSKGIFFFKETYCDVWMGWWRKCGGEDGREKVHEEKVGLRPRYSYLPDMGCS